MEPGAGSDVVTPLKCIFSSASLRRLLTSSVSGVTVITEQLLRLLLFTASVSAD